MEDEVGKKSFLRFGGGITGFISQPQYYDKVTLTLLNFRLFPANENVGKNYVIQDQ